MSKLLSQMLAPRLFTYTVDETKRTTEAHLCVVYPVSDKYLTLFFQEVKNGDLTLLKVVTRATEVDGGVRI